MQNPTTALEASSEYPKDGPFGRQREPVSILLTGDSRDVDYYIKLIARVILGNTIDDIGRPKPDTLKIYPAANND